MSGCELEMAEDALKNLSSHGLAELQYITAAFEPYSDGQRPDLVFWPASGPNQDCAFVVELRLPLNESQRLPSLSVLEEHKGFFEIEAPNSLRFGLAIGREIDDALRSALSKKEIEVFENVKSGVDLANRILQWSSAGGD